MSLAMWLGTVRKCSAAVATVIFVKPIRSTIDPTYTSRIIVHGCLLGHYSELFIIQIDVIVCFFSE